MAPRTKPKVKHKQHQFNRFKTQSRGVFAARSSKRSGLAWWERELSWRREAGFWLFQEMLQVKMQASAVPVLQLEAGVLPPHHPHRSQANHTHARLVLYTARPSRLFLWESSQRFFAAARLKRLLRKQTAAGRCLGFSGWTSGSELEHKPLMDPVTAPSLKMLQLALKCRLKNKQIVVILKSSHPIFSHWNTVKTAKCLIQENKLSGHH